MATKNKYYVSKWDHRKIEVNHELIEVTPKNVYRTKYTQLTGITCLSQTPVFSVFGTVVE